MLFRRPARSTSCDRPLKYGGGATSLHLAEGGISSPAKLTERQPAARRRRWFGAVKRKISVLLQKPLVIGEQFHCIARLEEIGLDRVVYLGLEQTHQLDFVPLRHRKHFSDRASFDDFLDVPAAFFVWIEKNVHFGNAAE